MSGLCILDDLTFRINPDLVDWQFEVYTAITPTVGGRVVQVLGSALSDIVVHGYYGENNAIVIPKGEADNSPGLSWRLAESFAAEIHRVMLKQSPPPGGTKGYRLPTPVRFFYPPLGWDFLVYIKALQDGRGNGVVSHQTGKFSYDYQLTLFPVKDNSYGLTGDNTSLHISQNKAVEQAITRISAGMGWKETKYNDPGLHNQISKGDANSGVNPSTPSKGAASDHLTVRANGDVVDGTGRKVAF